MTALSHRMGEPITPPATPAWLTRPAEGSPARELAEDLHQEWTTQFDDGFEDVVAEYAVDHIARQIEAEFGDDGQEVVAHIVEWLRGDL